MSTSRSIDSVSLYTGKVRSLCGAVCILIVIYLAALLLSTMQVSPVMEEPAKSSQPTTATASSNDPNIVTGGMATALAQLKDNLGAAVVSASNGLRSVEMGAIQGAQFIVDSGQTGALAAKQGATTIGSGFIKGLSFVARAPGAVTGKLVGSVTPLSSVGAIVTPAAAGQASLPVIAAAPTNPNVGGSLPALTAINNPMAADDNQAAWPIRGQITTRYGVPHWPYQPIHTGIDISDGQRPGVTPIRPFKPGIVTEVVYSNTGLGNYVVVDHGEGLTSVYAHLHTITVQTGQRASKDTQLGTEGSTGASTGTHLHFEIRLNGRVTDPHQHIGGHP